MRTRHLIIPPEDDCICSCDGWDLFVRTPPARPRGPNDEYFHHEKASPLWPSLKAVHVERKQRRRGQGRRAYWLRYGVIPRRFRQCYDAKEFHSRFPAVYDVFEAAAGRFHTVAKWEHRLGPARFAQERAKLEQSTVKGNALRLERSHAAALEEDALWERLYGDS